MADATTPFELIGEPGAVCADGVCEVPAQAADAGEAEETA
jgi:hypothetical protein